MLHAGTGFTDLKRGHESSKIILWTFKITQTYTPWSLCVNDNQSVMTKGTDRQEEGLRAGKGGQEPGDQTRENVLQALKA